jgi:integrase
VPLKERGANGRHRAHYETLYDTTELRAIKHRDALLAQIGAGLFHRPAPMTFSALCGEWLEQKKREGKRPKSLSTYGDVCKAYLVPRLGHLRLKELTPLVVRTLLNTLQDKGLSTCTIRYARTVLRLILKDAVSWGYLGANPAQNIKAPTGTDGRVTRCMNVEEARALVEAALLDPDDLIFAFALMTGLRPEEYLGLRRQDVDMVEGRGLARVRQVAVRLRGGGWTFPPPKTKKGIRDVPFPAWLHAELKRLELLVDSRRRAAGAEWTDYGLVFPSRSGVPASSEDMGSRRFRRLLKRAGLPTHFTLYSLRYTFATLQYMAGERDRVISDLMGHTRTDFTKEVYVRALPVMREQASDSLERLLFGAGHATFAQSASELPM